jgi:adenylate cyclase
LRAITRKRWATVIRAAAVSAVVSVAFVHQNGGFLQESDVPPAAAYAIGALAGMLIALLIGSFEAFVVNGPAGETLRRRPLAVLLVVRTLVHAASILIVAAGAAASFPVRAAGAPSLFRVVIFGLVVSALFNAALTIRSLVGGRTLVALLLGRYHRPQEEERIVLMLDIVGSTGIAERLGPTRFLVLLDRFVGVATEPIVEAGGEIYRYVGDEIIVTWPLPRGADDRAVDHRAVLASFAIEDAVLARRAMWEGEFGLVPRHRAALHAGPVVVGEIGRLKREIMLLGDTMNTASRIEDACREFGRACLASSAFLERARVPREIAVERLPPVALRGKSGEMVLYALSRR